MDDIWSEEVKAVFDSARKPERVNISMNGQIVTIPRPFPSPADWRDQWMYFLMVDRFNNPDGPPAHAPYDSVVSAFQGGTLEGVRQKLPYLKTLGVGAIWMTPVFRLCPGQDGAYHGYGFQNPMEVHPQFGTDAQLVNLVNEAHARGVYVIFDIVLNHAGDVFEYTGHGSEADWRDQEYAVAWRDEQGKPRADWPQAPTTCPPGAAVGPRQLRDNANFRRKGKGGELGGDFCSLKELVTGRSEYSPVHGQHYPVQNALIRIYQYLIAKFDMDGFRIDTLKYVEPEFARSFGNSMREFASSIGKKNFFTFGEIWGGEDQIKKFIGKSATDTDGVIGVDAALDFPLYWVLPGYIKGLRQDDRYDFSPKTLFGLYEGRKANYKDHLSSHGMASGFFVTFLDNHDMNNRILYRDPADPNRYNDQAFMAIAVLFGLQGIPCLYYGAEQGLAGSGDRPEAVREALWGKPDAFETGSPFYQQIQRVAQVRSEQPALRYGRQYFRPVDTGGDSYYICTYSLDVLAFSRILNDTEVLVVCNPRNAPWRGSALVDFGLNAFGDWKILYSNKGRSRSFSTREIASGGASIDGCRTGSAIRVVDLELEPQEALILGKA